MSSAASQSGSVPVPPAGISSQSAVGEEHRALRMARGRRDERPDALAARAVRLPKAVDDVRGDVGVGEAAEPHRHRLPVERALLRAEQLLHQPLLRAGEDVRGDLALVLDVAAQDRVRGVHLAEILELVERDQRAVAPVLLEPQRQVEQRMERGERVRARLELELHADPERREREAEAGSLQELLDPRADAAAKLRRVGALEPHGDVRERQHAEEVDEDRDHPLAALRLLEHAAEQARLPVLPRRVEPDVVPADGRAQQLGRLRVPVDQVLGRDRPRVDERVGVGDHRAPR